MEHSAAPTDAISWRRRASCRGVRQEMVPDDRQLGVQLAKKLCADCPVVGECLALAEQVSTTFGVDFAQGVWGGLTQRERATMVGLKVSPRPCPECGLICVPVSNATDRCEVCTPKTKISYADYRAEISRLLNEGLTFEQVADQLRLSKHGVTDACRRWKMPAKTASRRGRRPLKECGTLAAKERHRKHRESWENCACKHVAWKRGNARKKTRPEVNAH